MSTEKRGKIRAMNAQDVVNRAKEEKLRLVRFLYCDNGGIIRGKATHANKLATRILEGIGQTLAMQAFTGVETLATVDGMGPVGEFRLVPDPNTFVLLPYAPNAGSIFCDMILLDGKPWEACPRTFLKRMVARLAEQGMRAEAAVEHEFYLANGEGGSYTPADTSLFYAVSERGGLSQLGRYFIGGVLRHIRALVALTCGSPNSYQRLLPHYWSSAYGVYGFDNREGAIRIPSLFRGREASSSNLELKPSDHSGNPYLAMGALIAAGLDGIQQSIDPGPPVEIDPGNYSDEERERLGIRRLPISLNEALDELERDEVLTEALGPLLATSYIAVKRAEIDYFKEKSPEEEALQHFYKY